MVTGGICAMFFGNLTNIGQGPVMVEAPQSISPKQCRGEHRLRGGIAGQTRLRLNDMIARSKFSAIAGRDKFPRLLLDCGARSLIAASWLSGVLFGAYILLFFGGTALGGQIAHWNNALPGLHDPARPMATFALAAHFLAGGILLIFGPLQMFEGIRRSAPQLHRWLGRFYCGSAGIAGAGGLVFIALNGTIGGPPMSLGFSIYGALMVLAAARTYTHARAQHMNRHRAWAIRLFALTMGSWLYRMEYGFWFFLLGRLGHSSSFDGWFDIVMAFFFYLPNLLVAEIFIRTRSDDRAGTAKVIMGAVLIAAAAFVALATWVFVMDYWLPGMIAGIAAA